MNSLTGYITSAIGVILLALSSIPPLRESLKLPAPLSPAILTTVSIIVIALGVIIVIQSKKKKNVDVPIYQGKDVVGFRRI